MAMPLLFSSAFADLRERLQEIADLRTTLGPSPLQEQAEYLESLEDDFLVWFELLLLGYGDMVFERHPHLSAIFWVYYVADAKRRPYIVRAYVPGCTLEPGHTELFIQDTGWFFGSTVFQAGFAFFCRQRDSIGLVIDAACFSVMPATPEKVLEYLPRAFDSGLHAN